jgi:hypothetical protein
MFANSLPHVLCSATPHHLDRVQAVEPLALLYPVEAAIVPAMPCYRRCCTAAGVHGRGVPSWRCTAGTSAGRGVLYELIQLCV